MLVSRESEPGNWKNIMLFSFHFGTVEQVPFSCLPVVAEAVEGRAVPSLWLHSTDQSVLVPLVWFCAGCLLFLQQDGSACVHTRAGDTPSANTAAALRAIPNASTSLGGDPGMPRPSFPWWRLLLAALELWAGRCHCNSLYKLTWQVLVSLYRQNRWHPFYERASFQPFLSLSLYSSSKVAERKKTVPFSPFLEKNSGLNG